MDLLVDLLLVRRLPPWSGNLGKRLVRLPKVYVRDSGVLHALLGLDTIDDVLSYAIAGPSWEGFVIENLIAAAGPNRIPLFFRTEKGAEVDLIFERGGRVEMVVEIKRSTAPTVSRGFRVACDDLAPKAAFVVFQVPRARQDIDIWRIADHGHSTKHNVGRRVLCRHAEGQTAQRAQHSFGVGDGGINQDVGVASRTLSPRAASRSPRPRDSAPHRH